MLKEIKVLIVCSGNSGVVSPFVKEQVASLQKLGIRFDFFLIKGKGWLGYLMNRPAMLRKIKSFQPSIIHAHYGMSGMLAILQRQIPVVVTYHGSDINEGGIGKFISILAMKFSEHSIFVSEKLALSAKANNNFSVIPCGIDMENNKAKDKIESREKLGLSSSARYILFSSAFNVQVKNYKLAQHAVRGIENVELIELKGYSREEVNLLMNACDLLLITSKNEGSPMVVKEAVACGCPIVSTDVGDVRHIIEDIEGCFITDFSASEISDKIRLILKSGTRTKSRNRIYELGLDSHTVANKISEVYKIVLKTV